MNGKQRIPFAGSKHATINWPTVKWEHFIWFLKLSIENLLNIQINGNVGKHSQITQVLVNTLAWQRSNCKVEFDLLRMLKLWDKESAAKLDGKCAVKS